jgi:hypothetical protein
MLNPSRLGAGRARMDKTKSAEVSHFGQPIQQIVTMLLVCALVGAGAWLIHETVLGIIQTNPLLNGFIFVVFAFGVATCFWQVYILIQSVSWIEAFVQRRPGSEDAKPPRLLAPLASLLRSRGAKMQITNSSARSIQDSVATRIDEARDITRYIINLLVFLGLLGTFYGLATTVPAVVETIRSLSPKDGETGLEVFAKLMSGLESQLGGMGTAFSSSLLGLAGSLVLGLLELFAGHGQSRFYRELEEWLSSITRLGYAGSGEGDGADNGGDQGALVQILDNMTGQIEVLQTLFTQSEDNREGVEDRLGELAGAVSALAKGMQAEAGQAATLNRIAQGQERLISALTSSEGGAHSDAESRMRLRSIDVQLLRILEEIAAGRQESMADLRGDISALTQAIRSLARNSPNTRV